MIASPRWAGSGRAATRFDLREAIESTFAGKTSTLVTTPAAGCAIADLT